MDTISEDRSGIYEVEKIINYKICKNKKYYLIKWIDYPIHESTWEPKSNLINLDYMIEEFESEYPFSIDQNMYQIYCAELKKRKLLERKKNNKRYKELKIISQFISKKKRIEFFSKTELDDIYLDKLKIHLHLNLDKRSIKSKESELIVDLSSNNSQNDEMFTNEESDKENNDFTEKNNLKRLIMPEIE